MDEKRKSKRAKLIEDSLWECSVCTYRNSPDAFKCEMCDVRKGTSTRKPNPQVVAQQIASVSVVTKKEKPPFAPKPKTSSESQKTDDVTKIKKKSKSSTSGSNNRLSGSSIEVTVGNVSVIITDCPPPGKSRKNSVSENALSCKGSPSYVASCSSDADNSLDGSSSANKSFASTLSSPPAD